MPKIDPKGEVPNPIRAKLAHDIARPLTVVPFNQVQPEEVVTDAALTQPLVIKPHLTALEPHSTKLAKPKKVLFTVVEQKENDLVVQQIREAIGAETLGWSHINRAMWSLLRRAQDQLEKHQNQAPKLVRPSNGNPLELAKFEDSLADYLLTLFKEMPRHV